LSVEDHTVTFNLELNVEQTLSEIRRLETLLFRTISLIRRLGLPEDIDALISKIQRTIMTVRILHTSLIALQAASGPVGFALAGVGIATAALSFTDVIQTGMYTH